jgi:hypothetical protein
VPGLVVPTAYTLLAESSAILYNRVINPPVPPKVNFHVTLPLVSNFATIPLDPLLPAIYELPLASVLIATADADKLPALSFSLESQYVYGGVEAMLLFLATDI